jgi:hypothetical protein
VRRSRINISISKLVVPLLLSNVDFDLMHNLLSEYRYRMGTHADIWTQIVEETNEKHR